MDDIRFNVKNYTDIQGLTALKKGLKTDREQTKSEVAQQFEALMLQMMFKSMRDANQAFTGEAGHSDAFGMYQEWLDKQLALSGSGLGLAKQIETFLDRITPKVANTEAVKAEGEAESTKLSAGKSALFPAPARKEEAPFKSPVEFVQQMWGYAVSAAEKIGLNPKVLLAQAALESYWGNKVVSHPQTGSSYNLFNIKADPSWKKERVSASTLEQKDGIVYKEQAAFRAYGSFQESFADYIDFIQRHPRYGEALKKTKNPTEYLQALQNAHYATDGQYAEKILKIMGTEPLQSMDKPV